MKHNAPLNILPLLAAVAISAYRMVTVTSTGLNHASSGSAVIGVSGSLDVNAGDPVDVVTAGFIPVEYGATIAKGDRVGAGADGKAVVSATGGFVALEAGAAGYIGSVVKVLA